MVVLGEATKSALRERAQWLQLYAKRGGLHAVRCWCCFAAVVLLVIVVTVVMVVMEATYG